MGKSNLTATTRCVRCGAKATVWTGHVERKKPPTIITAGWCAVCAKVAMGWSGRYKKWMGKERR